jgi:hypothetical protein
MALRQLWKARDPSLAVSLSCSPRCLQLIHRGSRIKGFRLTLVKIPPEKNNERTFLAGA